VLVRSQFSVPFPVHEWVLASMTVGGKAPGRDDRSSRAKDEPERRFLVLSARCLIVDGGKVPSRSHNARKGRV
jgi:hypothetical protein